jgi:DNA-binding IclR family transcriptional regulator
MRALGNPTRFRVWDALRSGEATVTEIADRLPFSQQSVSAALLELHNTGLVEREQHGSRVCYRLTDGSMEHALAVAQLGIHRRAAQFARELRESHLVGD